MSDLDDPDDAYDASDPPRVRLVNLDRRLGYVIGLLLDDVDIPDDDALAQRVARVRVDLATLRDELVPP